MSQRPRQIRLTYKGEHLREVEDAIGALWKEGTFEVSGEQPRKKFNFVISTLMGNGIYMQQDTKVNNNLCFWQHIKKLSLDSVIEQSGGQVKMIMQPAISFFSRAKQKLVQVFKLQ